jgi:hypothetical protein
VDLVAGGADAAEQGQLTGACRQDDGEGVADDERPEEQRLKRFSAFSCVISERFAS